MYTPTENNTNDCIKVGQNIRRWRTLKGIRQTEFAKMLHISTRILSLLERNRIIITSLQMRIIAHQLKIKFTQLLVID